MSFVNVLMVCQDLEPGLKEVVMKVALAGTEDHTALDSLLPLLDIPQVPVPPRVSHNSSEGALTGIEEHTAPDSLLPLLEIPQVPYREPYRLLYYEGGPDRNRGPDCGSARYWRAADRSGGMTETKNP